MWDVAAFLRAGLPVPACMRSQATQGAEAQQKPQQGAKRRLSDANGDAGGDDCEATKEGKGGGGGGEDDTACRMDDVAMARDDAAAAAAAADDDDMSGDDGDCGKALQMATPVGQPPSTS